MQNRPILAIDLMSLMVIAYPDKNDMLFGGRWKACADVLGKLFEALTNAGAELVFFQDQLVETSKYETWMVRQNLRYKEHIEVIDRIDSGQSVDEILKDFAEKLRGFPTVVPLIETMATKHGILKFSVNKDNDVEMVRYANEHKALAILSDDSDFLIFKGDWNLWSIKDMDVKTLKTLEFNRKGLRSTLRLTDKQLSILPTFAGNDIIRYDEIKVALCANFRYTISQKFPNIAEFIRSSLPDNENEKVKIIASKMLGNTQPETLSRVKFSLRAYNTVSCTVS